MPDVELRALGPEHREQLAAFRCAGRAEPWADEVERSIRGGGLADMLAIGPRYQAAGLWEDDGLVAVSAWEPLPGRDNAWYSTTLAVRLDRRRRGYGKQLKGALIERAAASGITVIVSRVAFGNDPMIALNKSLGATIKREPWPSDFIACTISV